MNAHFRKQTLTFGEFIAAVYEVWGERRAKGIVRLAVKAHLVEFRDQRRIVVIQAES